MGEERAIGYGGGGHNAKDRRANRIEQDVEAVKTLTIRVESVIQRITDNARALGYFEPPPASAGNQPPSPVITTMADAIQALDKAIDRACGALNVFD